MRVQCLYLYELIIDNLEILMDEEGPMDLTIHVDGYNLYPKRSIAYDATGKAKHSKHYHQLFRRAIVNPKQLAVRNLRIFLSIDFFLP